MSSFGSVARGIFWYSHIIVLVVLSCGCRGGEQGPPTGDSRIAGCMYWQGSPPKIDGKLDEPGWQKAQLVPLISNRTTEDDGWARVAWSETCLYVAFNAPDRDVRTTLQGRDKPYYQEDVVEIFLRPNELPCYYELQISPRGHILDQLVIAPRGTTSSYRAFYPEVDVGMKTAAQIKGTVNQSNDQDQGFTVEVAIPFAELKNAPNCPPRPGEVWGVHLLSGDSDKKGRIFRESKPIGSTHHIDSYMKMSFVKPELLGEGRMNAGGPGTSFEQKWSLAKQLHAGHYMAGGEPLNQPSDGTFKEAKGYCGISASGSSQLLNVHPGVRGRPLGITLNIQGPQTLWLEMHLAQKSADKVKQGRGDGVALTVFLRQSDSTLQALPRTRILTAEKQWLSVSIPEGQRELHLILDCGPANNWFDQTHLQLVGDGQAPSKTKPGSQ